MSEIVTFQLINAYLSQLHRACNSVLWTILTTYYKDCIDNIHISIMLYQVLWISIQEKWSILVNKNYRLYVCVCLSLSLSLSVCLHSLSVCLHVPSVCLSVCISVCMSICMFVCLYLVPAKYQQHPHGDNVNVAGTSLKLRNNVKSLGVSFDRELSFDKHVNLMCRTCNYHLWSLKHVRKYLNVDMKIP